MTVTAERIAILGGGLMGHGIAQVFAAAGHRVTITDPSSEARARILDRIGGNLDDLDADRSALAQVEVVDSLKRCVADADWVFEAAPEKLELKQQIFADVERAAPPDAILASNTSVIPIGQIMTRVEGKHRALGTHWWNPPYLVPLVEVVRTAETSDAAVAATMALLKASARRRSPSTRMCPDSSATDCSMRCGARRSRWWPKGVCDARTVDDVVKSSFGARLAVLGPLENADLVGTELTQSIHGNVLPALDRSTTPSPYLDRLIAEGRLGFKSGEGFRKWTPSSRRPCASG